jgi:hypothetical protein
MYKQTNDVPVFLSISSIIGAAPEDFNRKSRVITHPASQPAIQPTPDFRTQIEQWREIVVVFPEIDFPANGRQAIMKNSTSFWWRWRRRHCRSTFHARVYEHIHTYMKKMGNIATLRCDVSDREVCN